MSDERDNAGVIAPPPLIFALPLAASLLANGKLRLGFVPRRARLPLGSPPFLGGIALMVWFFATMRRADTPIDPREPVSKLVTGGPFRYTRNPAYLGMASIYSGATILGDSLPSALLFPVVISLMNRGVIKREERYLEEKFGAEYRRYKERVRRWV